MDAVKVHRPRDWASRGDDFGRQAPQHFLYFFPLPQGQSSFRPGLGACNRIVFRLRGCLKSPARLRLTVCGPGFAPAVWKLEWGTIVCEIWQNPDFSNTL